MNLKDKLLADTKEAMKSKDSVKLGTLRFLNAAIKNQEIELRPKTIEDQDVLGVIKKLVKQRKESIEQYQKAGREDLVASETAEMKILETYLPQQMDRAQVEQVVLQVIHDLKAKTIKEMGQVMKEVIQRTSGTADNKTISELVKSKLQ